MSPQWAQTRPCPFSEFADVVLLDRAWQRSQQRLQLFRQTLQTVQLPPGVECVAVSGSLSRMEAHDRSDVDMLVVVDPTTTADTDDLRQKAYDVVWDCLLNSDDRHLIRPKPGGIFSSAAVTTDLTDERRRGVIDEDLTTYGQRMQLLLDAQPIYGHSRFYTLQQRILQWYTEERVSTVFGEAGPFHWLWQDIHRYWRSIRSRACWLHLDEPEKSLEVNLKLRSSRMVIMAAMLLAIEQSQTLASTTHQTVTELGRRLQQTPLERLTSALSRPAAARLLTGYQTVWNFTAEQTSQATCVPPDIQQALGDIRDTVTSLSHSTRDWIL